MAEILGNVNTTAIQVAIMLFLLIVGFILYKMKVIGEEGTKNMTDIAIYIATSAVIIVSFQSDYDPSVAAELLKVAGLSLMAHTIGIVISVLVFPKTDDRYKVLRYAAVFGNTGFMGIPLLQAIHPGVGVMYATVYMAVFNILTWTYGVVLYKGTKEKGMWKKIVISPVLISIAVSLILYILRIKLVYPVYAAVNYLSMLNTPLAMLVTGACVAKSNILGALKIPKTYLVVIIKMLLISVIMSVIMHFIPGLSSEAKITVSILSAVPSASMTVMFAKKYNTHESYAGELVVLTTVLSVVLLPLAVFLGGIIAGV